MARAIRASKRNWSRKLIVTPVLHNCYPETKGMSPNVSMDADTLISIVGTFFLSHAVSSKCPRIHRKRAQQRRLS